MIRLFIALKINNEIQQKFDAIITNFKSNGGDMKWVDSQNLHITLKFLGNSDTKLIDNIITELQNCSQSFQSIESDFSTIGGFPNLRKPKVIWADIDKNKHLIINLAESIHKSLSKIGFESNNKPFKPHLTLGRVKSFDDIETLTDYLQSYKFKKIPIKFDTIELIQSKLTQQGPIYKTLKEIKLSERFNG